MDSLDTLLDLLPPPWTQDPSSVVAAVLEVAALELDAADVAFEPDRFDQALGAPASAVVRVSVTVAATPQGATGPADLPALITGRLTAFVATLSAGTVVDAAAVLDALRDDARYQLDPLTLQVRFTLQDSFVEVATGGSAFTVQPGLTFTVEGVTLR